MISVDQSAIKATEASIYLSNWHLFSAQLVSLLPSIQVGTACPSATDPLDACMLQLETKFQCSPK